MKTKLEEAVLLLHEQAASFVLILAGQTPQISDGIGIKPLMTYLRKDKAAFRGGVIADKVIGKAAALMAVLGEAKGVYGEVMSEPAKELLAANGLYCEYGTLVPYIENRTKTGKCPMEETVWDIDQPEAAFEALEITIERLMKSN